SRSIRVVSELTLPYRAGQFAVANRSMDERPTRRRGPILSLAAGSNRDTFDKNGHPTKTRLAVLVRGGDDAPAGALCAELRAANLAARSQMAQRIDRQRILPTGPLDSRRSAIVRES